ncbi:isochorismatase family protein [Achromobacter sp. GG226]|uniref:isochorismatase family protein n=1 Tax=Verticiella alkaliphila TaxID=2779529 RepID=UPI001C0CDB3C|nr:isochorismatase family protein [Verticiella sp. GG226]MBU4610249.1 isochorismatase family protein [Verticiella sp. GG226]
MSDLDIFEKQVFGQLLAYGNRSAVLVIDFQEGFTREDGFGGYNINAAIDNTVLLLATARQHGVPVAHVRFTTQPGGFDIGPFGDKVPRLRELTADSPAAQFVPSVAPIAGEYVSQKRHASAFFGTTLASWLISRNVDTLLVAGCTTSGCVRASTVDASAYGLRPMVVADCVGDRAPGPHESSLFDLGKKYANIISLAEAQRHLSAASTLSAAA